MIDNIKRQAFGGLLFASIAALGAANASSVVEDAKDQRIIARSWERLKADLTGAVLCSANLTEVNLRTCLIEGANLTLAYTTPSKVCNISRMNLTKKDLEGVRFLETVKGLKQ